MCLAQVKNGLQDCSALGTSLSHCWAFAYNPQTLPAITFTSCQSSLCQLFYPVLKSWVIEQAGSGGLLQDQLESRVTVWC